MAAFLQHVDRIPNQPFEVGDSLLPDRNRSVKTAPLTNDRPARPEFIEQRNQVAIVGVGRAQRSPVHWLQDWQAHRLVPAYKKRGQTSGRIRTASAASQTSRCKHENWKGSDQPLRAWLVPEAVR